MKKLLRIIMVFVLTICCSSSAFSEIIVTKNKVINMGEGDENCIGIYNGDRSAKKTIRTYQYGTGSIMFKFKNTYFLQAIISSDMRAINCFKPDTDTFKNISEELGTAYAILGDKVAIAYSDDYKVFDVFDADGNRIGYSGYDGKQSGNYDSSKIKWISLYNYGNPYKLKSVTSDVYLTTNYTNNIFSYKIDDKKHGKQYIINNSDVVNFIGDKDSIYYIENGKTKATFYRINRKTGLKNIKPLPFDYCSNLQIYGNNILFGGVWKEPYLNDSQGEALFLLTKDGLDLSPFYKKEDFREPAKQTINNISISSFSIRKDGQRIARGYNINNAFISNNKLIYFDFDGIYYFVNEIDLKTNKYTLIKKSDKDVVYMNHSYSGKGIVVSPSKQGNIGDYISYVPVIGKTSTVNQGQRFEVILSENASTGYAWTYKTDNKAIQLVSASNSKKDSSSNKNIVGAPTNKIWTFKAVKKGKYKITFSYARSWEKGKSPAKTEEYTVTIK